MPFYPALKIRPGDSVERATRKRRTADRLLRLQAALSGHFAASGSSGKQHGRLRIGTWNLREFGGGRYGGRDFEALYYIAEIIACFDIVALQEVRADLTEFLELLRILGPDWDYLATDVTDGSAGNGERMVFLYDRRTVHFRNIAGELTLKEGGKIRAAFGERLMLDDGAAVNLAPQHPGLSGTYPAQLKSVSGGKKLDADVEIPLPPGTSLALPDGSALVVVKGTRVTSPGRGRATLELPSAISGAAYRLRLPPNSFDDALRQFARTPYIITFQAGWLKLTLCTVHIYYGDDDDPAKLEQRRSEIEQLTAALANKALGEFRIDRNAYLGVLGDFNIIGAGHPTMQALESNGFVIDEALKSIPGSNVARDKAYDQIAFWQPARDGGYTRLELLAANIFDYYETVFTDADEALYRGETGSGLDAADRFATWRTYKMSDHLPMWVELRTDFSDEYLRAIGSDDPP